MTTIDIWPEGGHFNVVTYSFDLTSEFLNTDAVDTATFLVSLIEPGLITS